MRMSKSDAGTESTSNLGSAVLESIGLADSELEEDDDSGSSTGGHRTRQPDSADEEQSRAGERGEQPAGREPDPGLPLDQVFEILKNRRRREVLHYLDDNGGTATLSELAEHIAALENDTTVAAISSSQRKRVYVGLYQCHLPKMDDMDIVEFEQNRGTIELAENAEYLEQYLQDDTPSRDWSRVYLGLAGTGAALFLAGQMGAAQVGLTPSVVLLGLIVGITCCAGWQLRQREASDSE